MMFINLEELEKKEPVPGFRGSFVHSQNMTFAYWTVNVDSVLPGHSHPQEQVTSVIEGRFEMTMEGMTRILGPGSVAIIPATVVHSGRAMSHCRLIDVFCPRREYYR